MDRDTAERRVDALGVLPIRGFRNLCSKSPRLRNRLRKPASRQRVTVAESSQNALPENRRTCTPMEPGFRWRSFGFN